MATKIPNRFDIYQLEAGEYDQAVKLTDIQRKLFQSYIGQAAHAILAMSFAEISVEEYKLQHAYYTGKIEVLEELLSLSSEEAKTDEHSPENTIPQPSIEE